MTSVKLGSVSVIKLQTAASAASIIIRNILLRDTKDVLGISFFKGG